MQSIPWRLESVRHLVNFGGALSVVHEEQARKITKITKLANNSLSLRFTLCIIKLPQKVYGLFPYSLDLLTFRIPVLKPRNHAICDNVSYRRSKPIKDCHLTKGCPLHNPASRGFGEPWRPFQLMHRRLCCLIF